MKINEVTQSGYYLALFHGSKMVRSFVNNCEWEPIYLTIVPQGEVLTLGKRNFKSGLWLQRFGVQNWTRIDNGNHQIHSVKPINVPSMEETNKMVTRQENLEHFLYVVRYIDKGAKNPEIISANPERYRSMINSYDNLLEILKK
jgi:hypothetical protein